MWTIVFQHNQNKKDDNVCGCAIQQHPYTSRRDLFAFLCCSELPCVAVCCSELQCIAVCCSVHTLLVVICLHFRSVVSFTPTKINSSIAQEV